MRIGPVWLNWKDDLACPVCHGLLHVERHWIECQGCGAAYRIRDGIPYFVDLAGLGEFEKGESEFHSAIAEEADRAHGQTTLRAEYLHNGFLAPILSLPRGSLLLDVACGSGVDVIRLAQRSYRIVGVDIAPGMIMTTKRKVEELGLSDRVFLCVANARQLPFRESKFRAAYVCAALHHMQDPKGVLGELARVTQTSGIVSIGSEPNSWIYKFRRLKHSRWGRRFFRAFRNDYTIGDQPPGDRETRGWSAGDWPRLVHGTGLELLQAEPIWYLNGIASLLGLHSLPRWIEVALCQADRALTHVPLVRYCSVKWHVITRKEGGVAQSQCLSTGC
jgi:ubiquinone/menaquinone biosynthesis C-methylase UbiE